MHFNDAILEYGFDCRARKLSDKTISNYQKQLRYFQRYLEAEFKINQVEDVRSFHVKQFLVSMDDKGRKPRYINDLLKVFKTFFNYMKKEGYIKERPTDKKTITVPHNYTDKLNAINSMIKEFGGADAQTKTFSGYIDECWRYAMDHSDTQLKTAARPSKAAAPKATPKPGMR